MASQENQKGGLVQTVAQFVTDTLRFEGVLYAIPLEVQMALFELVKEAGFKVGGYEIADETVVSGELPKFPENPFLPLIFFSQFEEEGAFAAGWLDSMLKGARLLAASQPLVPLIQGALTKVHPFGPIQLTGHPLCDRLNTISKRWLSHTPKGFIFHSQTTHDDSRLFYGEIGSHEECGGVFKLHPARNGWSRVACEKCRLSVPVHVTDQNNFGDLQQDINARVLGLPNAELPAPVHEPYPPGGRPSVES